MIEDEHSWSVEHDFHCENIRQQSPDDMFEFFLSDLHRDLPKQPIELRYGQIVKAVDDAIGYHLLRNQALEIPPDLKAKHYRPANKTNRSIPSSSKSNDGDDEDNEEDDNKKEDPSYRGSVA